MDDRTRKEIGGYMSLILPTVNWVMITEDHGEGELISNLNLGDPLVGKMLSSATERLKPGVARLPSAPIPMNDTGGLNR
jgi:hypothetical protein